MDITSIRRRAAALTATASAFIGAGFLLTDASVATPRPHAAVLASNAGISGAGSTTNQDNQNLQQQLFVLPQMTRQLDAASSWGGPTAAQNQKIQELS